jgi:type IV secretory pathway TrbD component
MAAVIWAPSAWLAFRAIRARTCQPVEAFLFGLTAWMTAHALAIGWARGSVGFVSPRYMDIMAVGPVINGTALALLPDNTQYRRTSFALGLGAAAWIVGVVMGVVVLSRAAVLGEAPAKRGTTAVFERNIRKLARDGDLRSFDRLHYPAEVPWMTPRELALDWLYDPGLRTVLPPSLRDPLPMEAEGPTTFTSPGAFQTTPARADFGVGSYGAEGNATQGEFRSRPLSCEPGRWLRFDVAGYLGEPGTAFALERADGSSTVMAIAEPPRESWRHIHVRCPAGPFRITASDTSTKTWFAFGSPVEVGWLGRLAGQAADSGRAVLISGLILAAFAVRSASSR